jgi:hypothetical protein
MESVQSASYDIVHTVRKKCLCTVCNPSAYWPVCFIKIRYQETGKKIRDSKSVQKSAKLVHLTFKVGGLQLYWSRENMTLRTDGYAQEWCFYAIFSH